MNRADAQARATAILGADMAAQLSPEDWDAALDQAVTLDPDGRLPGDPDWLPSHEPYWAAAEAVDALALRYTEGIESFTSEGSSFKLARPDYARISAGLRAKSPLSALTGGAIGHIDIDTGAPVYHPRAGRWA